MNDSPKIPKTYETVAALQGTDALLDAMMGLVDPIETLQRIYESTPIEAIEYLYGDTPAVKRIKKALSTKLTAKEWADLPVTLDPVQAAMVLKASPESVRDWIRSGELKASDLGSGRSKFVIRKDDLKEFMDKRQPDKPQPRKPRRQKRSDDRY